MPAYASPDDLRARARRLIPDSMEDSDLQVLLEDASVFLRATYPTIPESPDALLPSVLRVVTVAIVKRALLAEKNAEFSDGAQSVTDTAGPFTSTLSFRNSEGNFFISAQERTMLENALSKQRFRCITAEGW